MLDELLAITGLVGFEDYGSLRLSHVEFSEDEVNLSLEVRADEFTDIHPRWRVVCSRVKEHSLSLGYHYDLQCPADHVLLMPHVALQTSTSFYGRVEEPLVIVGALYERHREISGDWIPVHRYFNSGVRLPELIGGGFGMLAEGPEPLILAYEEVMQRYGFSTSHRDPKRPVYWGDSGWVEQTAPCAALILEVVRSG